MQNSQDNFYNVVYNIVRRIPRGKVTTYGTIARLAGNSRMSRQVGWALHSNPEQSSIPCHRVVNKQGRLADAFVFGGVNAQATLLIEEGVVVIDNYVDMTKYYWGG